MSNHIEPTEGQEGPLSSRPQRVFTLMEANALIPHFEVCLELIAHLRSQIMAIRESKVSLWRDNGNALKDLHQVHSDVATFTGAIEYIKKLLEFIQSTGAIVKDLDQGLIDFPYHREGRLVYLCWKFKEKRISFWHEVDAGFKGRQPL